MNFLQTVPSLPSGDWTTWTASVVMVMLGVGILLMTGKLRIGADVQKQIDAINSNNTEVAAILREQMTARLDTANEIIKELKTTNEQLLDQQVDLAKTLALSVKVAAVQKRSNNSRENPTAKLSSQ